MNFYKTPVQPQLEYSISGYALGTIYHTCIKALVRVLMVVAKSFPGMKNFSYVNVLNVFSMGQRRLQGDLMFNKDRVDEGKLFPCGRDQVVEDKDCQKSPKSQEERSCFEYLGSEKHSQG